MPQFDTLLIDSDILLYQTAFACERECRWDDDIVTLHTDANELTQALDRAIETLTGNLGGTPLLCLTHSVNFRKELYAPYKANRTQRKPLGFHIGRQHILQNYQTYERPRLEADDIMGILGTWGRHGNTVIVSGDKDLDQIPGWHSNMDGSDIYQVRPQDGQHFFWTQCLTGDATDNYPGVPGVGPKTAEKILLASKESPWATVVAAYAKKGLDESHALTMARLAKILDSTLYDFEERKEILWTPT